MYRAQRAFDKVDRLLERYTAAVREAKKVGREQLGPYAINWSDEEQKIYILSLKEQRQTRRWWRQLRSFGLRREGGKYDVVADMVRVQVAVDAEVAGCVEELVQKVEHACKPCPKVLRGETSRIPARSRKFRSLLFNKYSSKHFVTTNINNYSSNRKRPSVRPRHDGRTSSA